MDAELMPNSRGINDGDALSLLVEQGLGNTEPRLMHGWMVDYLFSLSLSLFLSLDSSKSHAFIWYSTDGLLADRKRRR